MVPVPVPASGMTSTVYVPVKGRWLAPTKVSPPQVRVEPTAGGVSFHGRPLTSLTKQGWMEFRRTVQPVFQDPAASLNPRMQVQTTLANVLLRHRLATQATLGAAIDGLLDSVGLTCATIRRVSGPFPMLKATAENCGTFTSQIADVRHCLQGVDQSHWVVQTQMIPC